MQEKAVPHPEQALAIPFVRTKLLIPRVRNDRVKRPHLTQRLEHALQHPLVLISAPAGFGKTSLLAEWAEQTSCWVAWLSLDGEEEDITSFLSYLVLAFQTLYPELGRSTLAGLLSPQNNANDIGLRLLINELAELKTETALIIDDYHLVQVESIHNALNYLVEHLPPSIHLMLASRVEPPINLARLRARHLVEEIHLKDLSLSPHEVESFLNEVMQLNLSEEACQQLGLQTEGWVAGLQLMALSIQNGENIPASLKFSTQQPHLILEYLSEEVMQHQPPALQQFLMCTAVVEQMCGPLCDALVESFLPGQDGKTCLSELYHDHIFITALDTEHYWYRYHALFSNFLRQRLLQTAPEQLPLLHRQASLWFEKNGSLPEAFKHALAAQDTLRAAQLVENNIESMLVQGELVMLANWIDDLPIELVQNQVRLSIGRAWGALSSLDVITAQKYLSYARQAYNLQGMNDDFTNGEIIATQALIASFKDNMVDALALTEQALDLLPPDQYFLRSILKFNCCFPMIFAGETQQAILALQDAAQAALQAQNLFIALVSLCQLGETYIFQGQLSLSEQTYLKALHLVKEQLGENSPLIGLPFVGLGEIYRERGDFKTALYYLTEGVNRVVLWMPIGAMDGFNSLARLYQANGQPEQATQIMQQGRQLAHSSRSNYIDDWIIVLISLTIQVHQGRLDEVRHWMDNEGLNLYNNHSLEQFLNRLAYSMREWAYLALGRYLLAVGKHDHKPEAFVRALYLMGLALPETEKRGRFNLLIQELLIAAVAHQALGQKDLAQTALHRALDLAEPERFAHIFLDEGEPLLKILLERYEQTSLPENEHLYLQSILQMAKIGPAPAAAVLPEFPSGLAAEDLSRREIEVLQCLARGASNQEIANQLVLSLNTVKKHVSSILVKLDAENRTQAVRLARQFGLID
jgi:LuxR family maltose regulon positive regulatory protein